MSSTLVRRDPTTWTKGFVRDLPGYLQQVSIAMQVLLAFVAYFPATVLLDRTDELSVWRRFAYLSPLAGVVWLMLAYRLWQHEIQLYQSSGH